MNGNGTDGLPIPSWDTVEYYMDRNMSVEYPTTTKDNRIIRYNVDATVRSVSLTVELSHGEKCPPSPSPSVQISEVRHRGQRLAQIRTNSPDLVRDFHEFATIVSERIMHFDSSLGSAVSQTIRAWHRLIDARALLRSQRIGLLGELSVLNAIGRRKGWELAVQAWVGPSGEAHDFALDSYDIEVKTTSLEARTHTVNGIDQLSPKPDRDLWCTSIQLSLGGLAGRTLPEVVGTCLSAARAASHNAEAELEHAIDQAGYTSFDSESMLEKWSLRSAPLILSHQDMPRIDSDALGTSDGRVSNVSYTVDLGGLASSPNFPTILQAVKLPTEDENHERS